ncbi:MAG: bile acid:sodium symporter family protein [Rhodospirillales bacterium]|nr:bile acid:sodium symporter family protein [Rhodospirillales bacterium]MDE0380790.1 bile acid:sodium symporter family protein [Rhodospirillales bacterium]
MGIVIDVVLPIALAFIMLVLGLGLTVGEFARVAKRPRDFLVGAGTQIVLLPVVAFILVGIWPLPPEIALGVVVIAAAPGGVTSNLLTAFGRGDVALSISLTAVTSLLSVVTVPFIVVFAHGQLVGGDAGDVSVAETALGIFLIVTLPALIGLAIRRWAGSFAVRVQPAARRASAGLFVLIVAAAIYQERENALDYMGQAGPVTAVLNVTMMSLGYLLGRFLASGPPQRISIAIECGLQNGTLAIAVATLLFGGGLVAVPAATYSLIMFGSALIFIAALRRASARPAPIERKQEP